MAVQQQQLPTVRYVDLPDLPETFADSIHSMVWDGQTLRVEFCVTRYPEQGAGGKEAQRLPACRLVMNSAAAVDLFNRLQQTMNALAQAGVVTQQKPPAPAPAGNA